MATLRDGMFTLNQFLVQRGIYKLSAYGTLPLDLLRAKENRRNPDAQMNLDLHLDNANLDILPTLTKYVQWATGPMKGNLNVSGTLEDYTLDGAIRLDDGTIKLRGMNNTIDHVKLDTEFAGTKVNLKELSAVIGDHGNFMAGNRLMPLRRLSAMSSLIRGRLEARSMGTFPLHRKMGSHL